MRLLWGKTYRLLLAGLAGLVYLFSAVPTDANPRGPQVIHGRALFDHPSPGTLEVSNTPNAIINWRDFSIQAEESTRFLQQSSGSAVLNRVTGGNSSQLFGRLLSNGRIFLINPNGMIVGPDAVIDTAGFLGSTLDITDREFLEGDFRFVDGGEGGGITNYGLIRAGSGGEVVLLAPDIENRGVIEVDDGNLILAAGKTITLTDLDPAGVRFEVRAPDNEVVNLGKLLAEGGAVGIFGGTLHHSSEINVDSARIDDEGTVHLYAVDELRVEGSGSISAGGEQGGTVRLLGERVGLFEAASVNASGEQGGGEILVGGNQSGRGPEPNSAAVYVGTGAVVRADAGDDGDGGRVIVFGEESARIYGELSVRGGTLSGDGGFVETSGLHGLDVSGSPDLTAPAGRPGSWLIDPVVVGIHDVDLSGNATTTMNTAGDPWKPTGAGANVLVDDIITALNGGGTVRIQTLGTGSTTGPGDIDLLADLDYNGIAGTGTLELNANGNINLTGGGIYDSATGDNEALNLNLLPGDAVNVSRTLNTGSGTLTVGDSGAVNFQGGTQTIGGTFSATSTTVDGSSLNLSGANNTTTDLDFAAGSLNITGGLTVSGTGTWTGGTITGGILTNEGTLTISGGSTKYLTAATLTNNATIDHTGGQLQFSDSTVENNGTYNLLDGLSLVHAGGTTGFENNAAGTVGGQAGAGKTATMGVSFNNHGGTVAVDSGTLSLTRSGTSTGGTFTVAADAVLDLNSYTVGGAHTGAGAGVVRLDSGTLTVDGAGASFDLSVGGFEWTGGTITGGVLTNEGNIILAGGGNKTLSGSSLDNNDIMTWQDGDLYLVDADSVLNNQASATFTAAGDANDRLYGSGVFNNAGDFVKQSGGSTQINVQFNNTGADTVIVQDGTLSLAAGGTHTGTFQVEAGGALQFAGGTHEWDDGMLLTGSGDVSFTGGSINLTGTGAGTVIDSGTSFGLDNQSLGGDGTGKLSNNGTFTAERTSAVNGILTNGGTLIVRGSAAGGALLTVDSLPGNNGTIRLTNSAADSGATLVVSNGSLVNTGTINSETGSGGGNRILTVALDNRSATTLNAGVALVIDRAGADHVNTGTININGGDLTVENAGSFSQNGGTINIGAGRSMIMDGVGFNWNGGTLTGALSSTLATVNDAGFNIGGEGVKILDGITLDLASMEIGGGTLDIQSGLLDVAGTSSINNGTTLELHGGTFNAGDTVTVNGAMDWADGTVTGNGGLAVGNTGTLNLTGVQDNSLDGQSIDNAGTVNLAGTGNLNLTGGAVVNNLAGGVVDIQQDGIIDGDAGADFVNAGTVIKNGGSGETTITIPFNNGNELFVNNGDLVLDADGAHGSTFTVAAGSTLEFSSGTHDFTGASVFDGDGTVVLSGADWTGTGSVDVQAPWNWTAGTLGPVAGVTASNTLDISGGDKSVAVPFHNQGQRQQRYADPER